MKRIMIAGTATAAIAVALLTLTAVHDAVWSQNAQAQGQAPAQPQGATSSTTAPAAPSRPNSGARTAAACRGDDPA